MLGLDPRAARITWTVAVVALLLWAVYAIRKTLFVFALALFLAYMIAPLVRMIDRRRPARTPRAVPVIAAFAIVLALIAVFAAWVGPTVADQSAQLASELPKLVERINAEQMPLPSFAEPWRERVTAVLRQSMEGAARSAVPFARGLVQMMAALASNAVFVVLIPILAFLFLKDGTELRDALLRWFRRFGDVAKADRVLIELHQALGNYVRSLGLLSLATFIAYSAFFSATGMPFGVLLAAVAALLEFIPVIGPLTAVAIAVLVALFTGYEHVLWIVAFVLAYRLFQDYVLAPKLMSTGIDVHPALIIFGFLAGEQLAGIPGMFLSVPVMATLVIVLRAARTASSPTISPTLPERSPRSGASSSPRPPA